MPVLGIAGSTSPTTHFLKRSARPAASISRQWSRSGMTMACRSRVNVDDQPWLAADLPGDRPSKANGTISAAAPDVREPAAPVVAELISSVFKKPVSNVFCDGHRPALLIEATEQKV